MSSTSLAYSYLKRSVTTIESLFAIQSEIEATAVFLRDVLKGGGTAYTCGNGGSACDAAHFAEELVARYCKERPGFRAMHFCDPGVLTCWANDYSFDSVFERQVRTFATNKDVVVLFSTSGNSANIIRAIEAAKELGVPTVALLGKNGGKAKAIADHSIVVASEDTACIQQAHITLVHLFCEIIEA